MNKIISMSVWGNNPRYIEGAKRQYEEYSKLFPEWTLRIYTDNIKNFDSLIDKTELVHVNDGSFGAFWRFRPLFEHEDNIVMVRDSDSRATIREKIAIDEWIQSDKKFHHFKDHEAHFEFAIMAGAFSYKGKLPTEVLEQMNIQSMIFNYYTCDQVFLQNYVYPLVKNSEFLHSMKSGWFADTRKKLKNKYSFFGNGYDENDMPLYPPELDNYSSFDIKKLETIFKFDGGTLL